MLQDLSVVDTQSLIEEIMARSSPKAEKPAQRRDGTFDAEDALRTFEAYLRYEKRHSARNIHATMVRARRLIYQFGVTVPTKDDARRVEEILRLRGNDNTTISHELHTLEHLAESMGIVLKIQKPKRHHKVVTYLNVKESKALLQACRSTREYAIISVLLYCGLRIGELVNLELQDVDLRRRLLNIRNTKSYHDRTVVLHREAAGALERWLIIRPTDRTPDAVFVSRNGDIKRDRIEVLVRELAKRAKINKKVTPHTLRHTCATVMLRSGIPLPEVALQLGHRSVTRQSSSTFTAM